jgi:hypothetical protein
VDRTKNGLFYHEGSMDMTIFKAVATIDRTTMKKIRKVLVAPNSKRRFIWMFSTLVGLLILSLPKDNYELITSCIILLVILLANRFLMIPFGKEEKLLSIIKRLKRKNRITREEYSLLAIFNVDNFEMKDLMDPEGKPVITMNYKKIRWLIEVEDYYIVLPRTRIGHYEWFNVFGIVDKTAVDENGKYEFIEFLKEKCKNIKVVEYKTIHYLVYLNDLRGVK